MPAHSPRLGGELPRPLFGGAAAAGVTAIRSHVLCARMCLALRAVRHFVPIALTKSPACPALPPRARSPRRRSPTLTATTKRSTSKSRSANPATRQRAQRCCCLLREFRARESSTGSSVPRSHILHKDFTTHFTTAPISPPPTAHAGWHRRAATARAGRCPTSAPPKPAVPRPALRCASRTAGTRCVVQTSNPGHVLPAATR